MNAYLCSLTSIQTIRIYHMTYSREYGSSKALESGRNAGIIGIYFELKVGYLIWELYVHLLL